MNTIIILALLSFFSSISKHENYTEEKSIPKINTEECSDIYPFQAYYIDLKNNNAVLIDGAPSENFKNCSKYAHRFENPFSDSISIGGRSFIVDSNKEKGIYNINIFEAGKLLKIINLPVEKPLPEVHEYYIHLFQHKANLMMILEDMYTTHYIICKYDKDGNELLRKEIEHTYITHPEPKTNHYNRYLYYKQLTATQMVFTSHIAFADKFKTIVMSMDDFSISEYDKTANGIILDENDENLAGFVTQDDDNFEVEMVNGDKYKFDIENGDPACEFILKGNLLYIANYHPISTGSNLYCFDLSTKKMKWKADVKQVNASHSEYYNTVYLSMYKDKILMEGEESYGNYLQIFDAETGERLSVFGSFFELD
jgi:hypothetical protein